MEKKNSIKISDPGFPIWEGGGQVLTLLGQCWPILLGSGRGNSKAGYFLTQTHVKMKELCSVEGRASFTGADPGFPVGVMDPSWGVWTPMRAHFGENVCGNERIGSRSRGHGPENFVSRSANAL